MSGPAEPYGRLHDNKPGNTPRKFSAFSEGGLPSRALRYAISLPVRPPRTGKNAHSALGLSRTWHLRPEDDGCEGELRRSRLPLSGLWLPYRPRFRRGDAVRCRKAGQRRARAGGTGEPNDPLARRHRSTNDGAATSSQSEAGNLIEGPLTLAEYDTATYRRWRGRVGIEPTKPGIARPSWF